MLSLFMLGRLFMLGLYMLGLFILGLFMQSVILLSVITCFIGPFENATSTDWKSFLKNLLKKSSKNGAQGSKTIII